MSEPTREAQMREAKHPCGECHLQPGETCDICGTPAPVAWMRDTGEENIGAVSYCCTDRVKQIWLKAKPAQVERYTIPLYTREQLQAASAIPPGCVVVPVEPTEAMLAAADDPMRHGLGTVAVYRAMIAAAQEKKP